MTEFGTVLPFQIDRSDGSSCLEPTYIVCLTGITDRQKVGRSTNRFAEGVIGEVPARIVGRPGIERRGR